MYALRLVGWKLAKMLSVFAYNLSGGWFPLLRIQYEVACRCHDVLKESRAWRTRP